MVRTEGGRGVLKGQKDSEVQGGSWGEGRPWGKARCCFKAVSSGKRAVG